MVNKFPTTINTHVKINAVRKATPSALEGGILVGPVRVPGAIGSCFCSRQI